MRFRDIASRSGVAVAMSCVLGGTAWAQTPSSMDTAAVQRGQITYRDTCAVCHGDRGAGNGPAAKALKDRPSDLTRLTKQYGTFPASHVEASIKGTAPIVAHGTSPMLMWGPLFLADANGDPAKADARIADLVQYIESIQRK